MVSMNWRRFLWRVRCPVTGSRPSLSVVAVQCERWMLPSPFDCFSLRLPQLFRSQFLFQSFLFLLSFLQVGRRCQVYELIGCGLILLDALSLPVHLLKRQQGKSVPQTSSFPEPLRSHRKISFYP